MKKNYLKVLSLVVALAVGSTPIFACTATPKANLSKPQTKPEEKPKVKQVSENTPSTDDQRTPTCKDKAQPKQVEPAKQEAPTKVEPAKQTAPTKVEPAKQTAPTKAEPAKQVAPTKVEPVKQTAPAKQTAPTDKVAEPKHQKPSDAKKDETSTKEQTKSKFVVDNFKMIAQALEKLGVTSEELDTMIKEGKNLPEVLEAKDICVNKFKKVLLKEYYAVIKQGVKDEQLTKEEGKMLKYAIKQKIMNWLEE